MNKTAGQILSFLFTHGVFHDRQWTTEVQLALHEFLDEGEEEPHTLPPFEEWFESLPTLPNEKSPHRYRMVHDMEVSKNLLRYFYNSLAAQLKPITGEEEPPQSFTTGTNDMLECKGVDPEVAHTLPPFEEWWEGLKKPVINDPHFHRQLFSSIEVTRRDAQAIYNSLTSQLKPITDEEVVRLFNEMVDLYSIQRRVLDRQWQDIPQSYVYRLKPKPPAKEDWEVAYDDPEINAAWKVHSNPGKSMQALARAMFDAGQKKGTG